MTYELIKQSLYDLNPVILGALVLIGLIQQFVYHFKCKELDRERLLLDYYMSVALRRDDYEDEEDDYGLPDEEDEEDADENDRLAALVGSLRGIDNYSFDDEELMLSELEDYERLDTLTYPRLVGNELQVRIGDAPVTIVVVDRDVLTDDDNDFDAIDSD